ncbi:MAG: hypothetical protein Q4D29_02760 [Lachnospiraceae bacterium]|nr:hypothetical protein [Lachnospiraceae bacterium]
MTKDYISVLNKISKEADSFYLFDIKRLVSWMDTLEERLNGGLEGRASLIYAIKANPFLTEFINKRDNRFEVCSPGEFEICMNQAVDTKKIVFSGVYKSKENIGRIFEEGFEGVITLESESHYELLKEVMDEKKIGSVSILPRLSSGNKFGMDEDAILNILKDAKKDGRICINGIQYFSGTQKKKIKVIHEELACIDAFCERIKTELGICIGSIEYGPGFFYDYYNLADHLAVFDEIIEELKPYVSKYSFALESGRFIAAGCGDYVTKVVDVKETFGKKYCMVDGGIHHVNYYGRMLGMNDPKIDYLKKTESEYTEPSKNSEDNYEVVGTLCTVNDILIKNFAMDNPVKDDVIVFHDAGAYSCTESSVLFLSRNLPKIYALLDDGEIVELRGTVESYKLNNKF